jgi:hypothetical protein
MIAAFITQGGLYILTCVAWQRSTQRQAPMTPPLTQVLPVFRRKPIPIKHSIAKAFRRDTEHPHLH